MKLIWQSLVLFTVLTVLTGAIYPLFVTVVGQLAWHDKSHGSLVKANGIVRGSQLIAQKFVRPDYFWPRPSASDFGAFPSGASNLGPTSRALKESIAKRRDGLATSFGITASNIPEDLLTTSGSGLDPHISPEAALTQVSHIVKERKLDAEGEAKLRAIVVSFIEARQLGVLGAPRVNVFLLNSKLDASFGKIGS